MLYYFTFPFYTKLKFAFHHKTPFNFTRQAQWLTKQLQLSYKPELG